MNEFTATDVKIRRAHRRAHTTLIAHYHNTMFKEGSASDSTPDS